MGRAEDLFKRLQDGGYEALRALVDDATHEGSYLDYKDAPTFAVGARKLPDNDLVNLRAALSAFANTDGGLILWGVATRRDGQRDVPFFRKPLEDCRHFAGLVDGAVSGGTRPPVLGVISLPIIGPERTARGYVATLIPASFNAPHQAVGDDRYYIRAGDSFVAAPHSVLAGLFGRRPQPSIDLRPGIFPALVVNQAQPPLIVQVTLDLILANVGSVVARDAYVSWRVPKIGSERSTLTVVRQAGNDQRFHLDALASRAGSAIARAGNRLAPGARQVAARMHFQFQRPFADGLELEFTVGCEGAPPIRRVHATDAATLEEQFRASKGRSGYQ